LNPIQTLAPTCSPTLTLKRSTMAAEVPPVAAAGLGTGDDRWQKFLDVLEELAPEDGNESVPKLAFLAQTLNVASVEKLRNLLSSDENAAKDLAMTIYKIDGASLPPKRLQAWSFTAHMKVRVDLLRRPDNSPPLVSNTHTLPTPPGPPALPHCCPEPPPAPILIARVCAHAGSVDQVVEGGGATRSRGRSGGRGSTAVLELRS
jgi:hypothetical protein